MYRSVSRFFSGKGYVRRIRHPMLSRTVVRMFWTTSLASVAVEVSASMCRPLVRVDISGALGPGAAQFPAEPLRI